ncbi:MAG: ribosome biogenesis GTP-binding protein YihA/YsxC [Acidobacteriota bacterium]|jgi:GTP-binding protein
MRVHDARLLISAGALHEYPRAGLPEIAFAGRSNVGKSSLLNRLVNRQKLARTSSTPGCTQRINFFLLNERVLFADLPGYGYAKVPAAIRAGFEPMVRGYLEGRDVLRLVWVLVDARHPPTELDRRLVTWLRELELPFRVALTKSDRLSGNHRGRALRTSIRDLELSGEDQAILTSARTRAGIASMWQVMDPLVGESNHPTRSRTGELSSGEDRASPPGDRATDPGRSRRSAKENTTP